MENNKQNSDAVSEELAPQNVIVEEVFEKDDSHSVEQLLGKIREFIECESLECDTSSKERLIEAAVELWDEITEENRQMRGEFLGAKKALEDDPRLAVLFNELMRGTPIRVALVRSDIFDFTPQSKDYDYDEYQQALAEHRKRRNEFEQKRVRHQQNCEHTRGEVEKFYDSKDVPDEVMDAFAAFIETIFDDFEDGRVDCELLERLWLGFTFEHKIEEAKELGRIEGLNAQIEKRRQLPENDGLPSGGSRENNKNTPKEGYIERILKGEYR